MTGGLRRALVAIAAALALADASIVALALPPILVEFNTSITGVAAIVGVYALVLALTLATRVKGAWGMAVFAAGSAGCALAPSLTVLLVFRAVQAVGAGAALLTAYEVLDAGGSPAGRRWWLGAALIGTAAGPAIGGVLTEVFDWRAIFVFQVPFALAATPAAWGGERTDTSDGTQASYRSLAALAFTAAAFTAVLFLLVLELVAGFAISPLRAALGVSILPLAALAAAAIPGEPNGRALGGAILLVGGAGALAFLPAPSIAWTIVPQLLAGAGMGLALPALSPERNVQEAARTLVARHAGIVLVLAILAPVANARLTDATDTAILQGASLVLDAQIDPLKKLQLAPSLLDEVDASDPRGQLRTAVASKRADFAPDTAVYDRLGDRLDDVVVAAIENAFRVSYLIAAALGLLGVAMLIGAWRRPAIWLAAAASAGAIVIYAVEHDAEKPPPVTLQDPCLERPIPSTGGISGAIQLQALKQLDQAACKVGSTREELALAIFNADRAQRFQKKYGTNPRGLLSILSLLGG